MVRFSILIFYFVLAAGVLSHEVLWAEEDVQTCAIDPGQSRIVFEGASTLHPIEGKAERFAGEFSVQAPWPHLKAQGDVSVEVESLLTGNKGLDRNMHRMFESEEFSAARCHIASLRVDLSGTEQSGPGRLEAVLTIRRIAQPFACDVIVTRVEKGLKVSGSTVVSLKAFDLRPPTILGVIKVRDSVTVRFDVMLKEK